MRLRGAARIAALDHITNSLPKADQCSSNATVYRWLRQYYRHHGFFESKQGKWVRENVLHNTAVKKAMEVYITDNKYKIVCPPGTDEESHKYFVAKHAADHLNALLLKYPDFQVDREYAAALPIKVAVMRVWLVKHFGMEWAPNQKGTANAKHECDLALQQRRECTGECKIRELNTLL